ncbi:C4orf27 family protein [Megaselia abdita]
MNKEDCKYWDKCYQKNPAHIEKYNHPEDKATESPKKVEKKEPSISPNSRKRQHEEPSEPSNDDDKKPSVSQEEMDITKEYNEVMKNLEGKNFLEIYERRVKLSAKAEYLELLKTNEFLRYKFLVEMPSDFYEFWEFCKTLSEETPEKAFSNIGLKLVGPFDFLAGKFHKAPIYEPGDYLRHWRFFYDPAEFQTVFVKEKSGIHYGFWRDSPSDKENLLVARNDPSKGCEFEFVGGNLFETLIYFIDNDFAKNPFNQATVKKIKKSIEEFLEGKKFETLQNSKRARDKQVVAKTFHKAGIVVPYEKKTQLGYRTLLESDANIKKYLKMLESGDNLDVVVEKLQPIISAASIAADECDFGTGLELGIDLFCSGHKNLHDIVRSLLIPAYSLLKRPQFIAISKAHMDLRKEGNDLSVFDISKD